MSGCTIKRTAVSDDNASTLGYDRTSPLDFFWYLSDDIWTTLGLAPTPTLKREAMEELRQMCRISGISFISGLSFFLRLESRDCVRFGSPLAMNFIMAMTSWVQHAFCDQEHPKIML